MPQLASNPLARNLRETNTRLGFWLDSIIQHQPQHEPQSGQQSAQGRKLVPQQLAALLAELMRAGAWLRELPRDREPEVEQALSEYRKHVERLRDLLPLMQDALLRERARLEQERARIQSAAEWARGSRQTF